jgi:eukaryotic-like serine/threonine-protein kinase
MLTGETFGRYEIRGKIGEGGMGEVYSAHDVELDRNVAIKLLPNEFTADEERRSRFRQEARVVSALNHPNVITIYEIGENDFGHFLATEFIEGKTLREVIKRESLTLPRMLRIIEQAANALVAAHHEHIIHRDVKPENIMVRRDGIVKVLDFGLAKPVAGFKVQDDRNENKTIPGTVMGSARYMSPEQARGLEVDERTDIWSLGVVLYEMLVGKAPFDGETTADTLAAVIYHEPEPVVNLLPNTPPELQRILRKSLQKDREERYQDVKDFALDVKELLYDIEHANSGDRSSHVISNPEFSENPTIIHRTASGNHQTDKTTVMTSGVFAAAAPANRSRWPIILGSVFAILILAIGGSALYNWTISDAPQAAHAFIRPQISRINTDGRVLLPAISPDGKYVAYVSGEFGSRSLVVRQIATDSIVTAVQPTNLNLQSVTFSPTGDYIYYCQTSTDFAINTLYQVPTLGGTPKKLIEDVDSSVTFSPDGKQFAFARHKSDTNEDVIFIVNAETLAMEPLISTKDTNYNFFGNKLAWSPDGRMILTGAGKRQSGFVSNTDVAEILISEKKIRPVNRREFFFITNVVWFADGSGFLFSGRETQNSPNQIWRGSYPGAEIEPITNDFNDYLDVSISSDGHNIITLKGDTVSSMWRYSPATKKNTQLTGDSRNLEGQLGLAHRRDGKLLYTRNEGKEADLWISDEDGKNARALLTEPGFSVAPVSTPDGRYIIFNLQKNKSSRIWRSDADGKNAVRLTDENPDYVDFNPQITPDSKYVIFQRQMANNDRYTLMKVQVEGGTVEPFYESDNWSVFQPRLSPDGKRIAYTTYDVRSFQKKLMIASVEGDKFGKFEREVEYNLISQFMWSPDSKTLTVLTNRGGSQNIWRQPVDGSAATQLTDFKSGRILNFAWTADGKELIIARGNTNNDLILIRDAERMPASQNVAGVSPQRPTFNLYNFLFSGVR